MRSAFATNIDSAIVDHFCAAVRIHGDGIIFINIDSAIVNCPATGVIIWRRNLAVNHTCRTVIQGMPITAGSDISIPIHCTPVVEMPSPKSVFKKIDNTTTQVIKGRVFINRTTVNRSCVIEGGCGRKIHFIDRSIRFVIHHGRS